MEVDAERPTIAEIVRSYPFRLFVYGVLTFVVFQLVFMGVKSRGAAVMGAENGPVETAQLVLALFCAACLFCAARWTLVGRAGLIISGCVVGYAAARESDQYFEQLFFDDAYKWLVGLPLAVVVAIAVALDRRRLFKDMFWLMRQPAATLFVVAGIFLCAVCQTLDRPDLWVSVSDASEAATTKAMVEEYAELFAYLLLAFSGIESAILARRGLPSTGSTALESSPKSADQQHPRFAA